VKLERKGRIALTFLTKCEITRLGARPWKRRRGRDEIPSTKIYILYKIKKEFVGKVDFRREKRNRREDAKAGPRNKPIRRERESGVWEGGSAIFIKLTTSPNQKGIGNGKGRRISLLVPLLDLQPRSLSLNLYIYR
jgi:hypothetical protein